MKQFNVGSDPREVEVYRTGYETGYYAGYDDAMRKVDFDTEINFFKMTIKDFIDWKADYAKRNQQGC